MKNSLFSEILVQQFNLKIYFKKFNEKLQINAIIRKKSLSLIAKTLFLLNLYGLVLIKNKKSDFLFLEVSCDFNVSFKSYAVSSQVYSSKSFNPAYIVKKYKFENVFDFFNFPVLFNLKKEFSLFKFLIFSVR